MAKKSFKDYIVKPTSERILNNISANLDKFIDVMRELSDSSTELCKKNPAGTLLSKNFKSHPHIHIGYYDERRNNVLYVVDALDGDKLIEKKDAVLLCDGRFTRYDSSSDAKTIQDPSYITGHVGGAMAGSSVEKKWIEGKYFYEDSIGLYVPVIMQDYVKAMVIGHVCDLLYSTFQAYQTHFGQPQRPASRESFDVEGYADFFRTHVSETGSSGLSRQLKDRTSVIHKCNFSDYLEIPKDSPILGGIAVYGDYGQRISQVAERSARGEYASITMNDDGRNPWTFAAETQSFVCYQMGSFPFRLGVRINQSFQSSRASNSPTDNNTGRLLAHNAKVEAYKVGFLMSDEEKNFFDKKDKEFKALLLQYNSTVSSLKYQYEKGELSLGKYKELHSSLSAPQKPPQDNPVYLGIEIELVTKGQYRSGSGKSIVVKDIAESKFGDHAILKSDGSLRETNHEDHGLEICTVPATLQHHLKMFNHFFEYGGKPISIKYNPKALNIIDKLMSNPRCGIHVHISRNSLSSSGWGKFQDFIYSDTNASFIEKMAGRKTNVYCERIPVKDKKKAIAEFTKRVTTDGTLKGQLKFQEENRNDLIRRVMVNLQNAHTVEVRIFKSSTDKNNVLRKFEFCDALVHMIQTKDIGLRSFDYFDFINFILEKDNRKRYINITRWLSSMGMIGHERKRVKNKESKIYNKIQTSYKYNLAKIPPTEFYKSKEFKEAWEYHPNNKSVSKRKA
jgi:hypothetical protein